MHPPLWKISFSKHNKTELGKEGENNRDAYNKSSHEKFTKLVVSFRDMIARSCWSYLPQRRPGIRPHHQKNVTNFSLKKGHTYCPIVVHHRHRTVQISSAFNRFCLSHDTLHDLWNGCIACKERNLSNDHVEPDSAF